MKPGLRSVGLPCLLLLVGGALQLGCKTTGPQPVADPAVRPAVEPRLAARVESFVGRTHVHGVPYTAARDLGAEAIPILQSMLADESQVSTWPNVVVTLAIVGDPEAGQRLIEFIRDDPGRPLPLPHSLAKYSALMALGYLVNHTADPASLEFLIQAARPGYWESLAPRWSSPMEPTSMGRNLQLANMAMLGLALSGHPEAIRALETLQEPEPDPGLRRLQAARSGLLDEALQAGRTIADEGLAEYYRRGAHEHHHP